MQNHEYLLEMVGITKTYPGVVALNDVSFNLKAGEVHALVGENGAGKSTLIKVLMGIEKKDKGNVFIEGEPIDVKSTNDASKHRISAVFQELSQIPFLTVAENVFLGKEKQINMKFLNRKELNNLTQEILQKYDICELNPQDLICNISTAKKQLAEIVKAIATKPRILILDEPTTSLTENEVAKLFNIIQLFKSEGIGIIYISHRMNELKQLADRVTVLRDGCFIECTNMSNLTMESIVNLMVGRDVDLYDHDATQFQYEQAKKVLEVKNISKQSTFKEVSFDLYQGEILGIAGLVGSGRSELMNLLFGIDQADSGEIVIDGETVDITCVQDALKHKIAMVPESRHLQGLVLGHSVEDNIALPLLKNFVRASILNHRKKRDFSLQMIEKYNIKTESSRKIVRYLSGGNQQKVVIAKWLSIAPRILIVDELTAGIDVHSKTEIHKLIKSLTKLGLSVIMISSEMPELLAHSDRIMVMNDFKVLKILQHTNQEEIMSLIMEDKNVCVSLDHGGDNK